MKTILTIFLFFFGFIITSFSQPTLTEVILPQYIQGLNGTNNNRVPFAFRVTLSGLTASATYRYFNQVVTSGDGATSNGAGNVIFANASSFTRTTSPSMSSSGQYGEFTTNSSGSYTGWFITEPTGNPRFTPGNQIFMRIMLNNGAGGTTVATRLTTTNYVTVINFGTSSSDGTGIRGISYAPARDFVFLYDNESGTGRPLTGTFIESDGTSGSTSYVGFYQSPVDGTDGSWGAIIPNNLSTGVRRIERRLFSDGSVGDGTSTDSDGIWPSGANTINPSGGTTPIVILTDDAPLPVELNYFTSNVVNNKILLNWSTSNEINNLGFEVQRANKSDMLNWEILGFVKGSGNSNSTKEYSFEDNNVKAGTYYYRLKQIDNDGSFNYSNIIEVNVNLVPNEYSLSNYPNPFNPSTNIEFTIAKAGNYKIKVYNLNGEIVSELVNGYYEAGVHKVNFNAGGLSSGMYIYTLQGEGVTIQNKLIILR